MTFMRENGKITCPMEKEPISLMMEEYSKENLRMGSFKGWERKRTLTGLFTTGIL